MTPLSWHCRRVAESFRSSGSTCSRPSAGACSRIEFWREFAGSRTSSPSRSPLQPVSDARRGAWCRSGRDIALYTGNDDNIVLDLVTPFVVHANGRAGAAVRGRTPGPLGRLDARAVELLQECGDRRARSAGIRATVAAECRSYRQQRRVFDAAHGFAGVSRVCTRSCAGKGCWRASGASIRTRR